MNNDVCDIRLQVMICTHKPQGLQRVAASALPRVPGVGYIVSCQAPAMPLPEPLVRDDIVVSFTPTLGLSHNRNHALSLVTAPYALIADDDLTFYPDGMAQIIDKFESDPSLDVATFMCSYPYPKVYPPYEMDLSQRYKHYDITSFEIALRMDPVHRLGLRFSPLMGIGAPYLHAGEEGTFVLSCLKRGLRGRFFPVLIASHPTDTTGIYAASRPGVLRANGAYVLLRYPLTAALRLPLIAHRNQGRTLSNLIHLAQGAFYAITHRRKLLYP